MEKLEAVSKTKPKKAKRWTKDEDECLRNAVNKYGACSWKDIAMAVQNRNDLQCFHRWQKVLKPGLTKGPWSKEEDAIIIEMVKKGEHKWASIAKEIPGRLGKQIRERYFNHLDPSIKKEPWTKEEDKILLEAQEKLGNKWAKIAKMITGRPENMVKNRWYVLHYPRKRKKLNRSRTTTVKKQKKSKSKPKKKNLDEVSSVSSSSTSCESSEESSILAAARLLLSLTTTSEQ